MNAPHHLSSPVTKLVLGHMYREEHNPARQLILSDYDTFETPEGESIPVDSTSFKDCPRVNTKLKQGDYLIVNRETGRIRNQKSGRSHYDTERAAKSEITRSKIKDTHEVIPSGFYLEPMVRERNHVTGVLYWESINTPACCSPSTETYHSM